MQAAAAYNLCHLYIYKKIYNCNNNNFLPLGMIRPGSMHSGDVQWLVWNVWADQQLKDLRLKASLPEI